MMPGGDGLAKEPNGEKIMERCIFCKIAAGDIPATKVLEDETCIAFMDIGPIAKGHVLLIPKAHYESLDDMPAGECGTMLKRLPALVRAVRNALDAEGVNVLQNNGKAAHQEVMHVHFHVVPRWSGDAWKWNWPASTYPEGKMEELAGKIRSELDDR